MIPDSWAKVNFSQFTRIEPGSGVTELLSVLLEKPQDEVDSMKLDVPAVLKSIAFLDTTIPLTPCDTNLEALPVGQYEDIKLYTKQMKGTPEDFAHYPVVYATYWQKPYDPDTVDLLIPKVNLLPCGEVLGKVQHYLKEIERIEAKWSPMFPKDGYTHEQAAAGFPQIDEYFGFFRSLIFAERNSKWSRDEWALKPVSEFKYFMLLLAKEGEANKKYSDGEKLKMKTAQQQANRRR